MNNKSRFLRTTMVLILALYGFFPARAQGLKSVMTLDFINIDKKENINYLEASLTDAVRAKLKENFAFREVTPEIYQPVAEQNFIYRQDFYTETAATNLGLLAKGDIVIAGGFRPVEAGKNTFLQISVLIIDTVKKKRISEFTEKAPLDSRIFDSVDKIATRITAEAASVLPGKDDFQRKGVTYTESKPFFQDFTLMLRAGGGYYLNGYREYFTPEQPALNLNVSARMPVLWERMLVQGDFTFFRHTLNADGDAVIHSMGLTATTANSVFMGYMGIDLPVSPGIFLVPKVGAGYVMQTTSVSGSFQNTFSNGFLAFAGGLDIHYSLNKTLDLSMGLNGLLMAESGFMTTTLQGFAGLRLKF